MHHLGAVDLREGDKVFRTAAGEAVLALDREDDVLMRRGKRRLGVAHAVVDLIPNDLALDVEARDLHRVDEGLLHVPAGKADQAAVPGLAGLEHAEGVVEEPNEGALVVLDGRARLRDVVDAVGRVCDDRVDALRLHLTEHGEAVAVDDRVLLDDHVPHLLSRLRAGSRGRGR